jgi:hypothetical protein
MPPPASASRIRTSHLSLDTFSPVNQNGSFEFDRVLKSGYVQKRTRKTKVCLQAMNDQNFLLITPAGLEIHIFSPPPELSLHLQRPERRQTEAQDPPYGSHCCSLPQGSQTETTKCLWLVLTIEKLPP